MRPDRLSIGHEQAIDWAVVAGVVFIIGVTTLAIPVCSIGGKIYERQAGLALKP